LITLRKRHRAFGRGTMSFLRPSNRKVLAFIRRYQDEQLLVVANLSRFVQYVELDLSEFKGMAVVELFGRTPFPTIGALPHLLSLGPHSFYWFGLERAAATEAASAATQEAHPPRLPGTGTWHGVFRGQAATAP